MLTKSGTKDITEFLVNIHPYLANIEKAPTEQCLISLLQCIDSASPKVLKATENPVMFPLLSLLMSETTTSGIRERALNCIGRVISSNQIDTTQTFTRLYTLTCLQIFDRENCTLNKVLPEELKQTVMQCLTIFIKNVRDDILVDIYHPCMIKVISQGVLLAITVAKTEKSISLRCKALQFILVASQFEAQNQCTDVKKLVSEAFSQFLPGLVHPLCDIVSKEETTHHQVIVLALRCLFHVIVVCLGGMPSEFRAMSIDEVVQSWLSKKVPFKEHVINMALLSKPDRSPEWISAAATVLIPLLDPVSKCHNHPHEAVREETVRAFSYVVLECWATLGCRAPALLDSLLVLTNDENSRIADSAAQGIIALREKVGTDSLMCTVREHVHEAVKALDSSVRTGDDAEVGARLRLLAAYLKILNPENNWQNSPFLLQSLLPVLLGLNRLQLSPHILHRHDLDPADLERYDVKWDSKNFLRLSLPWDSWLSVCKSVAAGGLECCAVLLMDGEPQPERLMLLNMLLQSTIKPSDSLVNRWLQYYLNINEQVDLEVGKSVLPRDLENMIAKIALCMEGVGWLVQTSNEHLEHHLLATLYAVAERIGSSYSYVRSAALAVGAKMAAVSQCTSLRTLIESNIDYLTDRIVIKLRRTSDVAVLGAVRVVAGLCPTRAASQLQHIVKQILLSSNLHYQSVCVPSYLRVFLAFVQCTAAEAALPPSDKSLSHKQHTVGFLLKQYIVNMQATRIEEESDENFDPKPKMPPHAAVALHVVRRCLHYLPICSDMQKVLCLEVLDAGVRVLGPWEDELLPVVHELWSPLVRRFKPSSPPLVVNRSFRLLTTLCFHAKDFIRARTLKEVMPCLREWLLITAANPSMPSSQHFKLQQQLLSGLGTLTRDLGLRERESSLVVEAATPYLSSRQPEDLQECAVQFYTSLAQYDPCFVLYYVQCLRKQPEFSENALLVTNLISRPA